MRRIPRQTQTSCRLCRTMKLKCNRETPCSNCIARNVQCERPNQPQNQTARFAETASTVRRQDGVGTKSSASEDVLSRLRRLEEAVFGRSDEGEKAKVADSATTTPGDELPMSVPAGEEDQNWLSSVGTRDGSFFPELWPNMELDVLPINYSLANSPPETDSTHKLWLPTRAEVLQILDHYGKEQSYNMHIVHLPTAQRLIERGYDDIANGRAVPPSHLALILTICASSAFRIGSEGGLAGLFPTPEHARRCTLLWAKSALDVLSQSVRTTAGSLEDVQARMLLSFLVYHLEGFTTRFRSLSSSALILARDLSMHCIDSPQSRGGAAHGDSPQEAEIKRRVWWHLVSTDWLLSLSGGPQEGIYLANPNHMCTKYPRNIDDEDLTNPDQTIDHPIHRPTIMTFYVLRRQFADVARQVVDAYPRFCTDWNQVDYQVIMDLDRKYVLFEKNMPFFFKLSERDRLETKEIERKYPQIMSQRYILAGGRLSHRLKLHQPFLTRTANNPQFEHSRRICLETAQTFVLLKRELVNTNTKFGEGHFQIGAFLHIFFLAVTILVMDLCCNEEPDPTNQRFRLKSVSEACDDLAYAESKFLQPTKYMKSLAAILKKYNIQLLKSEEPNPAPAPVPPLTDASSVAWTPATTVASSETTNEQKFNPYTDGPMNIDNFPFEATAPGAAAINFASGDGLDWDSLYSALDSGGTSYDWQF